MIHYNDKTGNLDWSHIKTVEDAQKIIDLYSIKSPSDLKKTYSGLYRKCVINKWTKLLNFPKGVKSWDLYTSVKDVQTLIHDKKLSKKEFKKSYSGLREKCMNRGWYKDLIFYDIEKLQDITIDIVKNYIKENNITTMYQFRISNKKLYEACLRRKGWMDDFGLDFYDPEDHCTQWTRHLKNKEDVISFLEAHSIISLSDVLEKIGEGFYIFLLRNGWLREVNLQVKNTWKDYNSVEDVQKFIDDNNILSYQDFCRNFSGLRDKCSELGIYFSDLKFKETSVKSYGELYVNEFIKVHLSSNISFKNLTSDKKKVDGIKGRVYNYVYPDAYFEYNNNVYWIEYNGIQHYELTRLYHKTEKDFEKQVSRDLSVIDYCRNNNIIYIEIPFIFETKESVFEILTDIIIDGNLNNDIIKLKYRYGDK